MRIMTATTDGPFESYSPGVSGGGALILIDGVCRDQVFKEIR
jgi:hypothetical protein